MSNVPSANPVLQKIEHAIRGLAEPTSYYAGLKIEDVALADNLVVFKRTDPEELKPKGVTHSYHHRFVLVIPLAGSGSAHVDGQSYHLSPGRFFLIFPHQFHRFHEVTEGRLAWLFFTFDCRHPDRLHALRNRVHRLPPPDAAFLDQTIGNYLAARNDEGEALSFAANFSRLLHSLTQAPAVEAAVEPPHEPEDSQTALMSRINHYIRSHLDRSLTLADLARHTGYSEGYLRAIFRKEFGVSLGKYMRHSRLSVAAAMLSQPDRPSVEKIASACGFESIFVFSRAFKAAMGMSPRAYCRFVQEGGKPAEPALHAKPGRAKKKSAR